MTDKITPIRARKAKLPKSEAQMAFDIYSQSLGVGNTTIKSTRHGVVAVVVSLAAMACGVLVGASIAALLGNAAVYLGVHGFIAALVYVMVYMLGVMAAMYASGLVAKYIATGRIVDDMNLAAARLSNWASGTSRYLKVQLFRGAA